MLDYGPEYVVAFPGGRGTANMIDVAKERGLTVWQPYRMIICSNDFETWSEGDLKLLGARGYARHHSTRILMLASTFAAYLVNRVSSCPASRSRKNLRG